jgi:hypothetical protein
MKNFIYLYTKNMPGRLYWKYLPRFWVGLLLMAAHDLKRGQLHAILPAYLVAAKNIPGMLRKRRAIQRKRKVSLGYVDSILYHGLPPQTQNKLRKLRLAK